MGRVNYVKLPEPVDWVGFREEVKALLDRRKLRYCKLGNITRGQKVIIHQNGEDLVLDKQGLRDLWFRTSCLLDRFQTQPQLAESRFLNYKNHSLNFIFPRHFDGKLSSMGLDINRKNPSGIKAAIIREKGVNGDREMAYSMYLAGFDVKDVHMTDLISGRETLEEINFIGKNSKNQTK